MWPLHCNLQLATSFQSWNVEISLKPPLESSTKSIVRTPLFSLLTRRSQPQPVHLLFLINILCKYVLNRVQQLPSLACQRSRQKCRFSTQRSLTVNILPSLDGFITPNNERVSSSSCSYRPYSTKRERSRLLRQNHRPILFTHGFDTCSASHCFIFGMA